MSNQDIENALVSGAAGGLSLQQFPYECPDSSFEYATEGDVLKPAVANPYGPPPKNKKQRDQTGRPTPVPSLNDVQPFMSEPDFVESPVSELETLLASRDIQNPYPYPGDTGLLPSYSSESPKSHNSTKLREQVKHALGNAWKYDPIRCSVKTAFQVAQELADAPNFGLTKEENSWIIGGKLTAVKKSRVAARVGLEQARKTFKWIKNSAEDDEILNLEADDLDQELDDFYGPDRKDLSSVDNESVDEGFCEPEAIATTVMSWPHKFLMEEGVTPGGIFQDSGISMDEGYAEYSLVHSLPSTAQKNAGNVPSDWPTFDADVAPLRLPKNTGRWLGLVGDQKQCEWPGRRQGPYDLHGLRSWVRASNSDHVEMRKEPEASNSESQDMAGSFTPRPVTRQNSVSRDVEAIVGHDVETTSLRISTAAEVQDSDGMVDGPSDDTAHGNSLPIKVTSPIELVERVQEVSEPMQGRVNGEAPEARPQSFGQEQPSLLHGNTKNGSNFATPERINHTSVSNKDAENNRTSLGGAQPVSEERPQHFPSSIENGSEKGPSVSAPHVIGGVPQINIDANAHARRSIPTTVFTTPVNQRIRQIQQAQVDTPATPSTININLTPEYDSDMDAEDASDGSLEARVTTSPTDDTQKGQSALGRYVQETSSHLKPAHPGSSTISLDGSESEEVSLIPTQERPSKPEGHAGFSKGVEIHQKKSDAEFTLSPPKASQGIPSSSNTAPVPATPVTGKDSAPYYPTTPFQLAHPDFASPGTPSPAPKASKANKNTVMNVFKSSKLESRSPQRARMGPEIVTPTPPTAAAPHLGSTFGSQGLLFHKAKKNERNTKNVLNSLKLSPERGSGTATPERENQDDYEDELAGDGNAEVYKGGRWVQETPSTVGSGIGLGAKGGRKFAQAVLVPSVRARSESEGRHEDVQSGEPQKKKLRRSMRAAGGADAGPFSDH
ncbi:MAG: hypothetical protein ALECFALPRED_002887 [Alectoria fallacina]|uniref:Uncharacterized protein n=1 Tax=Alectoria fallacina TaxID=1903189 RepID=A0A8H3FLJ1_9LECA|nr:MAG: hypothetical protein ALECFALPRED_002887 [Alectoria fallacina]